MTKIYKQQVDQLRGGLINLIKLNFIKPEGGEVSIEFDHQFSLWMTEEDHYSDEYFKIQYTVEGMNVVDGQCFLTGTTANFDSFDELNLEDVYDLYVISHILDTITESKYKVLVP